MRIAIELPDSLVNDLVKQARADRRTVQEYLALQIHRSLYGVLSEYGPGELESIPITRHRREPISLRTRNLVWGRGGGKCHYCGVALNPIGGWECDHVVPVSKGGTSKATNLVVACAACNSSKRAKSAEEFRSTLKVVG